MSEEKIITQEHIITTIKLIKNYTQTHTHTLTHIIQNNLSKKKQLIDLVFERTLVLVGNFKEKSPFQTKIFNNNARITM